MDERARRDGQRAWAHRDSGVIVEIWRAPVGNRAAYLEAFMAGYLEAGRAEADSTGNSALARWLAEVERTFSARTRTGGNDDEIGNRGTV